MLFAVSIAATFVLLTVNQGTLCTEVAADQIAQESNHEVTISKVSKLSPNDRHRKTYQKYGKLYTNPNFSYNRNYKPINVSSQESRIVPKKPTDNKNITNKYNFPKRKPRDHYSLGKYSYYDQWNHQKNMDLTGWLTVVPLIDTESFTAKRFGVFRIGQFQNGQYYLNPIRHPEKYGFYMTGIKKQVNTPFDRYTRYLNKSKIFKNTNSSAFSSGGAQQETKVVPSVLQQDSKPSGSHVVYDTKIKHHHHHHHHKYVKTILQKVPVEVPVKVIVDKPYIVEKNVPYPVEKIVEKVVEKKVHVPIVKKVPYPVKVKVPQPYPVKYIEKKYVPKPYPVIKHVPIYKKVKVPHPVPYFVEKKVPYPVKVNVPYPVEVEKKVPYPVEVEKKIPYPVKIYVPHPVPVETKVPFPVEVKVKEPYPVIKHVPVPVKVYIEKPIPVEVLKPYPVEVEKKVPYPVEVEKRIPIPVKVYIPKTEDKKVKNYKRHSYRESNNFHRR